MSEGPAGVRPYRPEDHRALVAILEAVLAAGELGGRTAQEIRHLLDLLPADPASTLVALDGEAPVGFVTPHQQLLAVHPAHRRRGHGTRLVEAGLAFSRERGEAVLSLAPPQGSEGAIPFLTRLGFAYDSSLWLLRLPRDVEVPPPVFPREVIARLYRPDDLPGYVALVNAAFVDHPSPLQVTESIVRFVHERPDFDPDDILLVAVAVEPDRPIGFCRTKPIAKEAPASGEVSLVGVLPAWRGRGLGRELLCWGVERLRGHGAAAVELSVEARNERALRLYERTGFERVEEWPRWSKPV